MQPLTRLGDGFFNSQLVQGRDKGLPNKAARRASTDKKNPASSFVFVGPNQESDEYLVGR
jgi:hypothetical protein